MGGIMPENTMKEESSSVHRRWKRAGKEAQLPFEWEHVVIGRLRGEKLEVISRGVKRGSYSSQLNSWELSLYA